MIGELLDEMERLLAVAAPSVVESRQPGLSDAEIDALLPSDLSLPEEARTWWRWATFAENTPLFPALLSFIPLSGARQAKHWALDIAAKSAVADHVPVETVYRPDWLPFLDTSIGRPRSTSKAWSRHSRL